MKTILVSGASGIVGYGILKSLRGFGYKLIGTTIYENTIANSFSDIFELAPKTCEANYIDWLLKIIKKHKIDMIIPSIEADMIKWNEERSKINNSRAFVLLNSSELITLCIDKWNFYKKIKDLPYAITSKIEGTFDEFKQNFGLPFLLKPRRGFASKGIIYVKDRETFQIYEKELGKIFIVQPVVGDIEHEYTASAFFNKNSELLYCQQLRRKLTSEGFTGFAQTVELKDIKDIIVDLAKILKPIGATNFQFRLDNGQLKLLEINPRISSSTSIRTAFGYNESKMSVEYFLDGKIQTKPQLRQGKAIRYMEDFIKYESNNI